MSTTFTTLTEFLQALQDAWEADATALPSPTYLVTILGSRRHFVLSRDAGVMAGQAGFTADCTIEVKDERALLELANKPTSLVKLMMFKRLTVSDKQVGLELARSLKALYDARQAA